jgi:serine protease
MSRHRTCLVLATWCGALLSLATMAAWGQEDNPLPPTPSARADLGDTLRVIVKFRSGNAAGRVQAQAAGDRAVGLATRVGLNMRESRALPVGLQLLRLEAPNSGESFAEQLERLRADPEVEFAEPDRRRYPHAVPTDPLYAGQWYLQNRVDTPSAVNAEAAWDLTTGDPSVVVAVIDTGVLFDHPDLQAVAAGGRLLPGYDFIDNAAAANDGNRRDANASDAGDFVTQAESNTGQFAGCDVRDSSWHGTRVSGIIGAIANNAEGIAGSTWSPWILPVRALGKCGGFDSDILDAMSWAGGLSVAGVPANPFVAHVLNLSLGSDGACSNAYRTVINELATRGVLVVVSAGNEGGPVAAPANCAGVAAVAGIRHAGTKVGFSSLGPEIAVGAPGGNCVNISGGPCLFSIDTTSNLGTTSPGAHTYTNQTNANFGTSFSAPIVTGIVALMSSVNGNLSTAQLIARLREGAKTPFPVSSDPSIPMCHVPTGPADIQNTECNCTTSTCGAGMANSLGAVTAALRPIASVATPATVAAGQPVSLDGTGSEAANGRTIAIYLWSALCGAGAPSSASTASTSVVAPATGSIIVQLTVTDDAGRQDSTRVIVTPSSATVSSTAACPPISVAANPSTASVEVSNIRAFEAVVTNAQDTSVTWQVNGVTGGASTVGTISALGVYTAPASVPSPATVTVTAVSVQDPTRSGSAQVTITPAPVPPAPPAASGGGGGGGAGSDLLVLLCLITAFVRRASFAANASARVIR